MTRAALLGAALLAACAGGAPSPSLALHDRDEMPAHVADEMLVYAYSDPSHDEGKPVRLSSLVDGWTLYEGEYALVTGVPREAFARLVAVRGDEKRILYRTTSLAGYVRIETGEQALEMVRLFSSVDVGYLFEDFGEIEVTMATGEPEMGEIADEEYRRLRLSPPTVTPQGSWFVITRYLADHGHDIWWVRELVRRDGGYLMTDRALVAQNVDISLPGYW